MEITRKINGKEYGFKFTLLTLKKFCEYKDIELDRFDDFFQKNFADGINTLLRASIDVHSKGKQVLDEYQMDELIETMSEKDLTDIYLSFQQSLTGWVNKIALSMPGAKKK